MTNTSMLHGSFCLPPFLSGVQGIHSQEYRQQLSQNFADHLSALHAQAVRGSVAGGGLGAAAGGDRPPSSSESGPGGGARGSLPDFLRDPMSYPMPLIPFFKCGPLRADVVQRRSAKPDVPGNSELAVAVTSMGAQAWLSPIHIWHLLSGACCWRQPLRFPGPMCCLCCTGLSARLSASALKCVGRWGATNVETQFIFTQSCCALIVAAVLTAPGPPWLMVPGPPSSLPCCCLLSSGAHGAHHGRVLPGHERGQCAGCGAQGGDLGRAGAGGDGGAGAGEEAQPAAAGLLWHGPCLYAVDGEWRLRWG